MSHQLFQSYVILASLDLESAESASMKPASVGKIYVLVFPLDVYLEMVL